VDRITAHLTAHSVLRDALDRASQEFRRSAAEFQTALQCDASGSTQPAGDPRVRQASQRHAYTADILLFALIRFEAFVSGGEVPADLHTPAAESVITPNKERKPSVARSAGST
jgi:hypothetical protein